MIALTCPFTIFHVQSIFLRVRLVWSFNLRGSSIMILSGCYWIAQWCWCYSWCAAFQAFEPQWKCQCVYFHTDTHTEQQNTLCSVGWSDEGSHEGLLLQYFKEEKNYVYKKFVSLFAFIEISDTEWPKTFFFFVLFICFSPRIVFLIDRKTSYFSYFLLHLIKANYFVTKWQFDSSWSKLPH